MEVIDRLQEHRRKRLIDWIADRDGLAEVGRKRRLTQSQVSHISQVTNGYSFGERAARAMESRLGMPPGYLDHESTVPVAHDVSLVGYDHPPLLTWETIVRKKEELPERFRCELPDDALYSERDGGTRSGTPVVFVRTDVRPAPGVGVLVEDQDGVRYIRVYRQGAGGAWLAAARNENYLTLDSERDGLRLLAVAENRLLDGRL